MNPLLLAILGFGLLVLTDAWRCLARDPTSEGLNFVITAVSFAGAAFMGIWWMVRCSNASKAARWCMLLAILTALGVLVHHSCLFSRIRDQTGTIMVGVFGLPLIGAPFVLKWFSANDMSSAVRITFAAAMFVWVIGYLVRSYADWIAGTAFLFLGFVGLAVCFALSDEPASKSEEQPSSFVSKTVTIV